MKISSKVNLSPVFLAILAQTGAVAAQNADPKSQARATPAASARPSKPEAGTTNCSTLAELRRRVNEIIEQNRYAEAWWGIKIVSLETGKTLFEHDGQKLLSPASNSKLFTVALALERLGPDYRIRTSLYAKSRPDTEGTIAGDLIVYGRGDPTINTRLHGGNIEAALAPLVSALTNAGVKRISGDLLGDDSYFSGPPFGSGWSWDDLEYSYGAEISALTINDNVIQVTLRPGERIGAPCQLTFSPFTALMNITNRTRSVEKGRPRSIRFFRPLDQNVLYVSGELPLEDPGYNEEVPFHQPAIFFVSWIREALARAGVSVAGKCRAVNWLDREVDPLARDQLVEVATIDSLPLRDLAAEILKPSQNLYADLLLAHVAEHENEKAHASNSGRVQTSEELGIAELEKFLGQAGIDRNELFFEEGSGLSRNNLTTPNAIVNLLRYMARHPSCDVYQQALPVAGIDGTLRNRMRGTSAAGNVRAKTGTLRWANSLSGYVTTAAGERLVFSIMLNRFHRDGGNGGRADIDAIAVLLSGFTGRSEDN